MNVKLLAAVAVLLAAAAGVYLLRPAPEVATPQPEPPSQAAAPVVPSAADQAGTYRDYTAEELAAAQAAGRRVVLFFHAPWCPFCRTADAAFRAKLSQVPADVTLLKVDYDSSQDLRRRYGVTYQHTFVQVDAAGDEVTQWTGGDVDTLNRYLR